MTPVTDSAPAAMPAMWELVIDICDDRGMYSVERTDRLRVPGGWLYRTVLLSINVDVPNTIAMCFVPGASR